MKTTKMDKLVLLIKELETKIADFEIINEAVSKVSVGWHIEHTLLATHSIIEMILRSDPAEYKWKFNFSRLLVFTLNKIPRGRKNAPKAVMPRRSFDKQKLERHIDFVKGKIEEISNLERNAYVEHPVLGKLKLSQAIKFLNIHIKHHIDIINDITNNKIA
jgi:hypothetical protein